MSAYSEALERYQGARAERQAAHADPDATELRRLRADAGLAAAESFKLRWAIDPEYNPDRQKVTA